MTRTRLRPLAALALVALIGAGCSSGAAGDGGNGGGNTTNNATGQDRAVRFAACMRKNGVPAFPDPDASSDQELMDAIEKLNPGSATFKRALGACKDLQPPGLLGGKATPQQMKERLGFAQCMRDNGIKDFPDPTNDGPLIDTNRIPSAAGRGARDIPGFQAAMDTCRDALADALGEQ
jgi:hypothetical protein